MCQIWLNYSDCSFQSNSHFPISRLSSPVCHSVDMKTWFWSQGWLSWKTENVGPSFLGKVRYHFPIPGELWDETSLELMFQSLALEVKLQGIIIQSVLVCSQPRGPGIRTSFCLMLYHLCKRDRILHVLKLQLRLPCCFPGISRISPRRQPPPLRRAPVSLVHSLPSQTTLQVFTTALSTCSIEGVPKMYTDQQPTTQLIFTPFQV